MNNTWKVSRYMLQDFKKALAIYYGIIIGIFILMDIIYLRVFAQPGNAVQYSGFGFSAAIFLFISGLNCFKSNFKFMQANNITRKRFYYGTLTALIAIAILMAFVDAILNIVIKQIIPYEGLFTQLYKHTSFLGDFAWSSTLMLFAISFGWFLTMLYYKCNTLMKLVVSIIPVFSFFIVGILNTLTGGILGKIIGSFLIMIFSDPYGAGIFFFFISILSFGLCFVLLRRMQIRE